MALGENIKKRREELKLSQEYVAEQLGVSRQAVSKWETGQSEPTASNLIQLAAVFEMNLSELVAPNKNDKEQSSFENEQTSTKPNLILRANLIKNCNYLTSSISIHLHIGNLPTSRFRFAEQRFVPWGTFCLSRIVGT